jgi:hypothetical protein
LNTDAFLNTAKEGATKKRKTNPPQTTNKGTVSKTHNNINKTCEKCDQMKLELPYLSTQQQKAWPQREEWVYLLDAIVVTALVFQLDTGWLNADALLNTAREGATRRKTSPPQHHKQQKGTVSNHKSQKQKNKTCEKCDQMKNSRGVVYIQKRVVVYIKWHTTTKAGPQRWREREREYTYF